MKEDQSNVKDPTLSVDLSEATQACVASLKSTDKVGSLTLD